MTELTPRQRRREATHQSILATAMELLIQGGIDGLTIGRLASELNYTKGALYRYFSSKDALIAALQVASLERVHARFDSLWDDAEAHLLDRDERVRSLAMILVTTGYYTQLETQMPADFALIRLAVGDSRQFLSAEDVAPVMTRMLALIQDVSKLIRAASDIGALHPDDAMRRAVMLWSSAHGNVLAGKFARFDSEMFDPKTLVRTLTVSALTGWGAAADELDLAITAAEELNR